MKNKNHHLTRWNLFLQKRNLDGKRHCWYAEPGSWCGVSLLTNGHAVVYYIVLNLLYETDVNHGVLLTCIEVNYDIMIFMTGTEHFEGVMMRFCQMYFE